MDELDQVLKNNTTDDLTWFCSLSESELDFLISLKKLVIQRARICGHEELVDNFDLKMLRGLGLVLMEDVKRRIQAVDDDSLSPSVVNQLGNFDDCNLLKTCADDTIDIEGILTEICNKKKSRKRKKAVEN